MTRHTITLSLVIPLIAALACEAPTAKPKASEAPPTPAQEPSPTPEAKPAKAETPPVKEEEDKKIVFGQNDPAFFEGIEGTGKLTATIATSMGIVRCELFEDKAPIATANFVGLARGLKPFRDPVTQDQVTRPFYDGLAVHRVVPGFVVHFGDPTGKGSYTPGYTFKSEIIDGLGFTAPGMLAMSNHGANANGAQAFITADAAPFLNGKYTIFGQCGELEVVKAIAATPVGPNERPLKAITISEVKVVRGGG